MSKLIEVFRIGIHPIGYLIVQELGLNLRGLVPGTRGDWIGLVWKGKERIGLKRIILERI